MVVRTVELASYDAYVSECPAPPTVQAEETVAREARMSRFPFAVMLRVSYPELDFANRWCWSAFGPRDGECLEAYSEYRSCAEPTSHVHGGCWTSCWFEKTDYDFGFSEWYFESSWQRDLFIAHLDNINWGEHYGAPAG